MRTRILAGLVISTVTLAFPFAVQGADDQQPRKLSEKEERRRLKRLRDALLDPFKRWLKEEVRFIVSSEEREAFIRLATDAERQDFIERFWLPRDPTPDSQENEFKDEHYRRIAYAN